MMTLEEVWENLRQDPEIKATMEEVDKSYKLFKKIENLIVADLEAKLAESERKREELEFSLDMETTSNQEETEKLFKTIGELKQQLAEKDAEVQSWKDGTMVVKLGKLEEQLAEKEKEIISYEHELENYEHELEVYKHNDNIYANSIRSFANKNKQERNQTAIAILKKVKKLFEEKYAYDVEESDFAVIYETDIDEIIDQQIKSLKGEINGNTN